MSGFNISPAVNAVLTPIKVDFAAGGNLVLVAATPGKLTRMYRALLVPTALATIKWVDGAGPTDLTGVMSVAAGVPLVYDYTGEPWFTTSLNSALTIATSAIQWSGTVYVRTEAS